jgi:hypothetical protein
LGDDLLWGAVLDASSVTDTVKDEFARLFHLSDTVETKDRADVKAIGREPGWGRERLEPLALELAYRPDSGQPAKIRLTGVP